MEDINHYFSADAILSGTGDLSTVNGSTMTQQRIVRMVCTPEDGYEAEPGWGVGAGAYIGKTKTQLDALRLKIASRLVKDGYALRMPAPEVTIDTNGSFLFCTIKYADAATGETQQLTFQV